MKIKQQQEDRIKVKQQSIKQLGNMGVKCAAKQVEGGQELQDAVQTGYMLAKPVLLVTGYGAKRIRKKQKERREERRREREKEEQNTRQSEKKKEPKKQGKREKGKESEQDSDQKKKHKKRLGITRIIRETKRRFTPRTEGEGESSESQVSNFVKDNIVSPFLHVMALVLVIGFLIGAPVLMIGVMAYQTPYAIYLPPVQSGQSVQEVTAEYLNGFQSTLDQLQREHARHASGRIEYVGYEGTADVPDNFYDIIGVYMAKYGTGNQATVIDDTTKTWLLDVVNHMCSYETETAEEVYVNAEGVEVMGSVLVIRVTMKDYEQMITEYPLSASEAEWLREFMKPENRSRLKTVWKG